MHFCLSELWKCSQMHLLEQFGVTAAAAATLGLIVAAHVSFELHPVAWPAAHK